MKKMNVLDWIALILVVIGGLNWGLVGIADFNVVAEIFGADSTIATVVYVVVGLAALYMLAMAFMKCPCGKAKTEEPKQEMPQQPQQ